MMSIQSKIQLASFEKRFSHLWQCKKINKSCWGLMSHPNFLTGFALLALVFILAIPLSAYGVDGQIKITQPDSFPIVIDQSGSYVLTRTITVSTIDANGIEINADNVTLNLNGHPLIGPGKEIGSSGNGKSTHAKTLD